MLASDDRRAEILAAARLLLEGDGPDAVTMRALGDTVGMRAPSLYKHVSSKRAVERALIDVGVRELVGALDAALAAATQPMLALAAAYRTWAVTHPHMYRLVLALEAERERPASVERSISLAPRLLSAAGGDVALARALWGLCHGLALLEIGGHFPSVVAGEAAWASRVAALRQASAQIACSTAVTHEEDPA